MPFLFSKTAIGHLAIPSECGTFSFINAIYLFENGSCAATLDYISGMTMTGVIVIETEQTTSASASASYCMHIIWRLIQESHSYNNQVYFNYMSFVIIAIQNNINIECLIEIR